MHQLGMETAAVKAQQSLEFTQGLGYGRAIRIFYPGMEQNKGGFDVGLRHGLDRN